MELPSLKEAVKHLQEASGKGEAIYVAKLQQVTSKLRIAEMQCEEMLNRHVDAFEKLRAQHAEDLERAAAALAAKQEQLDSSAERVAALRDEVAALNHGKVQMMLAIGALIKHNESKEHHL